MVNYGTKPKVQQYWSTEKIFGGKKTNVEHTGFNQSLEMKTPLT